jgi:hypothetical protein
LSLARDSRTCQTSNATDAGGSVKISPECITVTDTVCGYNMGCCRARMYSDVYKQPGFEKIKIRSNNDKQEPNPGAHCFPPVPSAPYVPSKLRKKRNRAEAKISDSASLQRAGLPLFMEYSLFFFCSSLSRMTPCSMQSFRFSL